MAAYAFDHPPRSVRVWVRGVWSLPDGRQITRTVSREVACEPGDEERVLIALDALMEELRPRGMSSRRGTGGWSRCWGRHTDKTTAEHAVKVRAATHAFSYDVAAE